MRRVAPGPSGREGPLPSTEQSDTAGEMEMQRLNQDVSIAWEREGATDEEESSAAFSECVGLLWP